MPDYQNGKIYKLVNDENDDVYYGSTSAIMLSKRFGDHKRDYRCYVNGKGHFRTSFNILKYESCKIILVENFPCNSKYELESRERYYIENFKCVNKYKPAMINTMADYKNGKIYKLVNDETDDEYYGSTIQTLKDRFSDHKYTYTRYLNGKCEYTTSFEISKYKSCRIELVENFPCNSKYELEVRESYYIRNFKCVNSRIPRRTQHEYYQDNREKILQYHEEYYQDNKEKYNEYYQDNREKILQQKKQYREDHREKYNEYNRQYYKYQTSWGGSIYNNSNCSLLKIDPYLFT
jgi:hypothetical protein